MNMYTLLIAFAVVMLIGVIFKTAMKFFVVSIAIFVLFGLGFVWGPNDLNEKLGLNKYLTSQTEQKVDSFYGKFAEKREQHGNKVINQDQMKKDYYSAENTAKTKSKNWFLVAKDKVLVFIGVAKQEATTETTKLQQSNTQNQTTKPTQPTNTQPATK